MCVVTLQETKDSVNRGWELRIMVLRMTMEKSVSINKCVPPSVYLFVKIYSYFKKNNVTFTLLNN